MKGGETDMADHVTVTLRRDEVADLFRMRAEQISEECWAAGWMMGIEDELPEVCAAAIRNDHAQEWGGGTVAVEAARSMAALADALGGWDAAFKACAE